MKKKSIISLVVATSLVVAIGIGSTLAYFTDRESVSNVVTMGHVEIDLTEPNYAGNIEGNDEDIVIDVPGTTIEKDPTITLASGSEDAYVRMVVNVSGDELDIEHLYAIMGALEINDGWTIGELPTEINDHKLEVTVYYNSILTDEENANKAVLFNQFTIPADWGNEVADKTFKIAITAEAIQAENFTPEYNVDGAIIGWNGVTAETYTAPVVPQT